MSSEPKARLITDYLWRAFRTAVLNSSGGGMEIKSRVNA